MRHQVWPKQTNKKDPTQEEAYHKEWGSTGREGNTMEMIVGNHHLGQELGVIVGNHH